MAWNWDITNEEYIQRAISVHGDRYGYELTEYSYGIKRIVITCKKHGQILVNPVTHIMNKSGCLECYRDDHLRTAPRDRESFIAKSRQTHGDKYNYDKVNYIDYKTPVEIVCPIHGSFFMKPFVHIQPAYQQGCPKCSLKKRVKERTGNRKEFVTKARQVHGDKYDYNKVVYVNRLQKVIITCPIHGDFEQKPADHIRGIGCQACGNRYFKGRTREELLKDARKIHRDRYKYHNIPEVCNEHMKIDIECPKHGIFKQTVKYHLKGGGCPLCNNSKHANLLANELDDAGIHYIREQSFDWLKRTKSRVKMRLDFYLPEQRLAIEYQGAMHFGIHVNNKYSYSEKDFETLFERDRAKYELCKKHDICILYFCYNKEYIPEDYIDKVYSSVNELIEEIKKHPRKG